MAGERPIVIELGADGELAEAPGGGTTCRVREYARLSDGRELTLRTDRGWTSSAALGEISVRHVVRNIADAVLPDDAEATGNQHDWNHYRIRLRADGFPMSCDELRTLPFRVVIRPPSPPTAPSA
jgi:hypothetical protein